MGESDNSKKSVLSYMTGENKFSLALVAIAFFGQLLILSGKYFGFEAFAEQLGGFTGEFIALFMLYFGGATIKSALNKKKADEEKDA